MLGKRVQANFNPSQRPKRNLKGRLVYKGTIPRQKDSPKEYKAYFIGNNCPDHVLFGIVSAVIKYEDYDVLVIAEHRTSCYEPEVVDSIRVCGDNSPEKVICLFEKSCGAVIYKWDGNRLSFLLIKNKHAWHWAFPKGHIEQGENERQTAEREVFEETGLRIKTIDGFRQTCEYRPFGTIKKHVVLFLARSYSSDVTIQVEEIDKYAWVTFRNAQKMFKHENDKRVLRRAKNWIMKNDRPNLSTSAQLCDDCNTCDSCDFVNNNKVK